MAFRSCLVALLAAQASAVWLAGVNIAGCEIGVQTNGDYQPDSDFNKNYGCPYSVGPSQMQHFANNDGFNVFRIPVPWQKLVANNLEVNKLDRSYTDGYYGIVNACLNTGAHCIIDIHNYGRWWAGIVGQGGAGSDKLAETWRQIAADWAGQPRIIFGIMNEPHDLNLDMWVDTLQACVHAIRGTGATSQMIFLSGDNYQSVFSIWDYYPALSRVKDYDGSTTNLIIEGHQYFDNQGGTSKPAFCQPAKDNSGVSDWATKFQSVADYLKSINRKMFIGELGGGPNSDCVNIVCSVLDTLNRNGDQFIGWTSWAAGNWWSDYELNEMPTNGQDVGIVRQCFAPKFKASQ